jgi:class 3 adenylate cyclase
LDIRETLTCHPELRRPLTMGEAITTHVLSGASVFVGREREMGELLAGFEDARSGRGRLFLLSGEPGIGKTRIAHELASIASANGARVAWGRCWEGGGAPAYWPWIQVMRACVGRSDREQFATLAGQGAHDIAQLVPEFRQWYALDVPGTQPLAAEQARFRLFESVAALLKTYAQTEPLVVILDDLHDADQQTLLLLRFVARELPSARMLIVGTYRYTEVRRSPALGRLVGAIIREGHQIPVMGLGESEIARLVRESAGTTPSKKLVAALYQATAGNPLFLDGVVRLMVARGKSGAQSLRAGSLEIPDGVREAIRRNLDSLSAEIRSVLDTAAVLGIEIDLRALARVSALSPEQLHDFVNETVGFGILVPAPDASQRYRFSHALVRDALYDDLSRSARTALHATIAQTLEREYQTDPDSHLTELAHHFTKAASLLGREKAIDYSIRAGDSANTVFAYEDAVEHLKAALEMMERHAVARESRADLMVKLGDIAVITDRALAVKCFDGALQLYEALGRAESLADVHSRLGAALSVVSPVWDIPRAFEHFRKAEEFLSGRPESPALGFLYIGISMAAEQTVDIKRGLDASALAMGIGERLKNDTIWTNAAVQHATYLLRSGRLKEAYRLYDAAWENADRLNDGFEAAWLGGYARMALWDPLDAQRWYLRELEKPRMAHAPFRRQVLEGSLAIVRALGGRTHSAIELAENSQSGLVSGMIDLYQGDRRQAEVVLSGGHDNALRTGSRDEQFNYQLLLARIERAGGHYDRAEKLLEDAIALCPDDRHWLWEMQARPDLVLICVRLGKLVRAGEHLARCRQILASGEDWRGLVGHVARAAAVLAAAEGRLDEAEADFAQAVTILRRYHTPFEEAATLRQWARVLAASGNHDRASEKFNAAIEVYRSIAAGQNWIERVAAERSRVRPPGSTETRIEGGRAAVGPNEESTSLEREVVLRKEDDLWTVAYAGTELRLKDIKGLSYLARLMSHPNLEFHSLDLVAGAASNGAGEDPDRSFANMRDEQVSGVGLHHGLGDAGEMLDASAKSAYRIRITQLRQELEEAKELGNLERAERAEEEIDKVSRELARAVGLFGRDRRAISASERARVSVTRAIKAAIEAIARKNPALGGLLGGSVKTGTFCCYVPQLTRAKAPPQRVVASEYNREAGSIDAVAAAAVAEPRDLSAHAAPDGTVTILFSDVENSSALFERLGDLRAQEILRAHNAIVREQTALQKGFEVKSMGDGFMIAFSGARRALLCAMNIQKSLASYSEQNKQEQIRVRMGLHVGEVIRESADFFGKAVILAARIAARARGGEILVSSTLRDLTESAGDLRFAGAGEAQLKGFSGTHRLYKVIW